MERADLQHYPEQRSVSGARVRNPKSKMQIGLRPPRSVVPAAIEPVPPQVSSLKPPHMVLVAALIVTLASTTLVACGTANSPEVLELQALAAEPQAPNIPTALTTPTTPRATATLNTLTAIVATHVAHATRMATNRRALRTAVALTHAPTDTPGPPPAFPSPTPILGMLPGCSNVSSFGMQAISCWRGIIGGTLVEVDAGRGGRDGDRSQGVIKVRVRNQQGESEYRTPNRVGAVRIVSVTGTLLTLVSADLATPQAFVFDLSTRRWISR